ncbi:MAG TPA: DUF1501 domain-containing protein [Pirellulales bacterium]|jgi:hypothetical protein|nr:DUF1501 domain-containing protein [Pirellulales bacterium]
MHAFDPELENRFTRRKLLQFGGAGCLGVSLPRLFEARAAQAAASSAPSPARIRSCILLFYYGGPSHLDTYDLKPEAPAEVRGSFKGISSSVPGLTVCEHLPQTARVMHKLAVVRSFHHPMRNHNSAAVEALCGRTPVKGDLELLANDPTVDFPCYGAALSRLTNRDREIPAHVALPHVMYNVVMLPGQTAGFLGAAHNPFQVTQDPSAAGFRVGELQLPADLSAARLEDRQKLLSSIAATKADSDLAAKPMNVYQERAFNLLRSEEVRRGFDLNAESPAVRDRYGRHKLGQSLLLARRLVEAGVQFVNVNDKISNGQLANWDSHQDNFPRLKDDLLPPADQAFSALIEDLDARGLLDTTLVVGLAEFGRTPRINPGGGRDHWPDCYSILLAGGGFSGGAVYGASDKLGAYPAADPVTPGDLAATIFAAFGIDPATEVRDALGRPYRVAEGRALRI